MTPPDREALLALAERVEGLEGPDREVDTEVHMARGWRRYCRDLSYCAGYDEGWTRNSKDVPGTDSHPAYTASLDAAMQLVPEGSHGVEVTLTASGIGLARTWTKDGKPCSSKAATPALALTAASLRAMAEQPADSGRR